MLIAQARRASLFTQHSCAAYIRDTIGSKAWDRLFKFTVERDPWDRAVSRYWWERQRRKESFEAKHQRPYPGISECLRYYASNKLPWLTNWDHYAIDEKVAVDKVLFYERMRHDLEKLIREAGISGDVSMPRQRTKSGFRPDGRHYSELLSEEDRDLIARICHREIKAFGYEFQQKPRR